MKRKIIWSARAQISFDNLILFLEANWEKKVVENFFQEFIEKVERISENPEMFRIISEKKKIRRCVIKRRTLLFYRVKKDFIELVLFIDARQNPNNFKF